MRGTARRRRRLPPCVPSLSVDECRRFHGRCINAHGSSNLKCGRHYTCKSGVPLTANNPRQTTVIISFLHASNHQARLPEGASPSVKAAGNYTIRSKAKKRQRSPYPAAFALPCPARLGSALSPRDTVHERRETHTPPLPIPHSRRGLAGCRPRVKKAELPLPLPLEPPMLR